MTQITGFKKDNVGSYIEKDPQAELDYTIDWSDWKVYGDDFASSVWEIETITDDENPITEFTGSAFITETSKAVVYLTGGTSGNHYRITNTVTTVGGLTDQRYFRIFVKDRTL